MLGAIGLVVMNGILSLVIYPFIKDSLGADAHGKVLFYTAIMNLLAGSFGSAANYARLKVLSKERETKNGDYNVFLMISFAFVCFITVLACVIKKDTANDSIVLIILLIFMTVLRMYADVEFRETLSYGKFCLYYVIIGVGYLPGLLLFRLTGSWVLILLPGEVLGLLFVLFFGKKLRKKPMETSKNMKQHLGMMAGLTVAYLLSDFVGQSDRLLFPLILADGGDALTSKYYAVSLVGKTMSLLSTPLNGVLMGHLSNEEGEISRKNFAKVIGLCVGVFILVTALSVVGSLIFVKWRYPDYAEELSIDLYIIANAGQVMFFICNTLMVIVLRYTHSRNQIITSAAYIVLFFIVTVPLIIFKGIYGMAYGLLIVNAAKFIIFSILGLVGVKKDPEAVSAKEESNG